MSVTPAKLPKVAPVHHEYICTISDVQPRPQRAHLAFVGLGGFATELALASQRAGNIQIVRCFTRSRDKRWRFCRQFGGREAQSFDEICRDPLVQGVVLATPNDVHCEQTVALAQAGKHVFVEKPLCNHIEEARRMIDACEKAGVILAVGHQERRQGAYRRLRRMILGGELGVIHSFQASHCGDLVSKYGLDDWRFHAEQGVGPIHHKGIHKIDLLHYFFGRIEAVATMGQPMPGHPGTHTTTVTCLRFASGLVGTLHSGYSHNDHQMRIFSQHMQVTHGGHGDVLSIRTADWKYKQVRVRPVDGLVEELQEFAQAVLGRGKVEVDGRAGAEAVAVAHAAMLALRHGREVRLDDVRPPDWV